MIDPLAILSYCVLASGMALSPFNRSSHKTRLCIGDMSCWGVACRGTLTPTNTDCQPFVRELKSVFSFLRDFCRPSMCGSCRKCLGRRRSRPCYRVHRSLSLSPAFGFVREVADALGHSPDERPPSAFQVSMCRETTVGVRRKRQGNSRRGRRGSTTTLQVIGTSERECPART